MKTVLIYTMNRENITPLLEYYNDFIKGNKRGDNVKVIVEDNKFSNKYEKFIRRLQLYFNKYDLIISDYFTWAFVRSKKSLFMCHGYGTKMSPGLDEIENKAMYRRAVLVRKHVHSFITLSDNDERYFYKWDNDHGLRVPEYKPLGIARNDKMFDSKFIEHSQTKFNNIFKRKDEKFILYAPTWRGYKIDFIFDRDDFVQINNILRDKNCKLVIKQHPSENFIQNENFEGLSNIINGKLIKDLNTEEWLTNIDLLISDYSSIYVDYLLLNKPVAFITYDIDKYNATRGLVIDKNNLEDMPGRHILTIDDFRDTVLDLVNSEDRYIESRRKAIDKFHKFKDGDSSKRVWSYIFKVLNI